MNEIIINWTLVVKRDPQQIIKKFDKSIQDSIEISAPTNLITAPPSLCARGVRVLRLFISFGSRADIYFLFIFFRGVCERSKAGSSYEIVQALIVDVQWRILKWSCAARPG